MMRPLLGALAAISCLFYATVATATDSASSKNFVDALAKQVLSIVQDSSLDKASQQRKIEGIFTDKVDINFVAKFALGKHWREATPAQQSAYVAAYKPFILKNYASRLTKYSGQTYTLQQARPDGDAEIVTMEIKDPNTQNIFVDYRLVNSGNSYKISDIVVEGVSLLNTQRSEFDAIVGRKGIDGLIEALKNQVAARP